jgi:hypothetical protein
VGAIKQAVAAITAAADAGEQVGDAANRQLSAPHSSAAFDRRRYMHHNGAYLPQHTAPREIRTDAPGGFNMAAPIAHASAGRPTAVNKEKKPNSVENNNVAKNKRIKTTKKRDIFRGLKS